MKKFKICDYCGEQFLEGEEMLKALIYNKYYCDEECFASDEGAYYVELEIGEDEQKTNLMKARVIKWSY